MDNILNKQIKCLFDIPWDIDITEEEEDKLLESANLLVAEYNWPTVYDAAFDYLKTECKSPESAVNFAHNYWGYGWADNPIPNPYEFLGYFYYRIDFETAKYDSMDILDSLCITILPKAGFSKADLYLNTQYMPESDPKIIAAVEEYKEQEKE